MSGLRDFIVVTALSDGRRSIVRADSIVAVHDIGEEEYSYGVKPSYRTIDYSGGSIDVVETLDEISEMIYNALL